MKCLLAAAAIAVCATASPVSAQIEQGRLTGIVTDAQNAVLPGVTVTAKSPALIGSQTSITETDGRFRFPSLPPGTYTLAFELAGFQTLTRQNIVVTTGNTMTVDAPMQLASLQESVTVTGASPVVDMSTTKVGTELSAEKLASVPTATDMWSVIGQSQGVRMRGFDVGGSHKSQGTGYEAFGVRESREIIDGVDMTIGNYPDYFANEEIAVSAAGADVEVGTAGASVQLTVKSGGNQVHGIENLTYEGEQFVGDNVDDRTAALGYTGQPNLLFWEGHWDLGGPVKKDKLWFYAAYNHFHIDKAVSGIPRSIATDLGIFDALTSKATYRAGGKDTLIGMYQWGLKQKPLRGLSALVPPESILAQDSPYWTFKGEWQRVWSNRLFTNLRYAQFGFDWPMTPAVDAAAKPPRSDLVTGQQSGAGWDAFSNQPYRPQVYATTTYFRPSKTGSHDLKGGFEYDLSVHRFAINGNSGPIQYLDRNGSTDRIQFVDVGRNADLGRTWTGADDRDLRIAGYVQDRWAPGSRVTLQLGLRYEHQKPHYRAGRRDPVITDLFPTQSTPGATLLTRNSWAPRIGMNYDVSGKGITVVKAYYGRFYTFIDDALSSVNPGGANYKTYQFNDLNGNRLYDGPQEVGTLLASQGGVTTIVDPDFKLPTTHEISGSVEHQFWGESSLRFGYVRKMRRNERALVNISREGQFTVPFTTAVNLVDYDGARGATVGQQAFNLVTIPTSLAGVVNNVITNRGDLNFDTISVGFTKRFTHRFFIQSGYDYQWRDEPRGGTNTNATTASVSNTPLTTDVINVGYFQNVNPAVSYQQKTTTWQGRLLGRYQLPMDIGVAANYRVQSGFNYTRVIQVPVPNLGTVGFFTDDLRNHRSDTVPILDLRLDKAVRFGHCRVQGMIDIFNAMNSNAATNFFVTNGANYGKIIAALDPRTFQLSARFDF
jgi:hypothetical protein